ncbi:MAG: ABC transporter ATP-binding protein [Candidatus Methylacidiphilales bacterium]
MALIEVRDVRRIYRMGDNEVRALDGVTLDIERGEYVSIVGPSGSGKSTLMHLLGCLDVPSSGAIRIDDITVNASSAGKLSKIRGQKIGFVFQSFNLMAKLNIFQNVELPLIYAGMPRTARKKRVMEVLDAVGLADRCHHKSNELSGGQNQRAAIARALVNQPQLILADEPTGALDSQTGENILKLFRQVNSEGQTVILVTHDPDIAEETPRKIALKDGKIIEDVRRARGERNAI